MFKAKNKSSLNDYDIILHLDEDVRKASSPQKTEKSAPLTPPKTMKNQSKTIERPNPLRSKIIETYMDEILTSKQ